MKFKKIKKYYADLKENQTLKKVRDDFRKNIGEIKKGNTKVKYIPSKFDKKISGFKKGLDVGLGYDTFRKKKGGNK